MNAKVILYLFGMEWRRLRIWLAIFWLFLLLEALPHLAADFDLLSGFAKLMARKYHHFPQDGGLRALVWSDLGQVFPKWMPFLMSMNGAALVMAVIVCSLIGMEVAPGIRLRPVRIREEVSAKVLALGLFVILPIVALVGLNLLSRGFGGMVVAHAVGGSVLALAPMVGALALFGRLCGGFWRWVGGMVGLLVLIVIAPQLGAWYVPFPQLDLWGAEDNAWRTGVVLVLVLAIVVLLKGKTRSFRPVVIAWPLLFLALMFGFYADQSAKAEERKRSGLPEVPALAVNRLTMEGTVGLRDERGDTTMVRLSGGIQVSGIPAGYFVNWTANGKLIPRKGDASAIPADAGMRAKLAGLMVDRDYRNQTLPYELEGAALRSAIAEAGVALPRLPSMTPFRNRGEELQFRNALIIRDGKFVSGQPLDVEATLSGLVFRYRLAEELPLDTVKEYNDGRSRLRIRTSLVDEKRVNVDLSSIQEGDPNDRMDLDPQVVLWDPDSGSSVLLRRSGPVRSRLLSHCWFRLLRFHNVSDYPGQVYPDLGSMNVRSIRVLVYVPEILGVADRKVNVPDMPVRSLPQGSSGESWGVTFSNAEARDFFERYPARRPDPETCTAEEAGKWVALVLSRVPPYDSRWSAREIACYVPRHSGMFLRFPGGVLSRSEMTEAMRQEFPEKEKGRLFEALAAEPAANRFDALYEVVRSRGWEGEVREILRRRVSEEGRPTFRMLANSLPTEDRELYPRLISQLDGSHQWGFYLKVRDLPGIEPALSEAIRRNETEARERGETNPDAYAIAAGHGSREALRTVLSNIESFLRGGSPLSDSRRMLSEAIIFSGKRGTPDHYYARLRQIGADGFEWDPFLRLWIVKNSQP